MQVHNYSCAAAAVLLSVFSSAGYGATAVGRIAGAFAVGDIGSAQYSIPLKVAPGIAGMEPKLSLSYDSDGGGGLLGQGWSIAGLSAISRCQWTIAQDGAARPVVFDADDRFCLDGSRLRLVAGTYGASGSEYRTEIESFMRITALGVAGNGPASFQATTRDGVIIDYGATTDSSVEAQGKGSIRVWAVSKITDSHGNYIEFQYEEDAANGSYRPKTILYTARPGQSADHAIEFKYEPRPSVDVFARYVWGSVVRETQRLVRIEMWHNSAEARRYDLTYLPTASVTSKRSLLASIAECAGGDCLSPTTIEWQNGTATFNNPAAFTAPTGAQSARVLDINGDGVSDIAYPDGGTWWIRFGQLSGSLSAATNTGFATTNYLYSMAADYNGDGLDDLLYPTADTPQLWNVLQSNGSGFTLVQTGRALGGRMDSQTLGDVNGDGLDDIVSLDADKVYLLLNTPAGFDPQGAKVVLTYGSDASDAFGTRTWQTRRLAGGADFDGDGKTDFLLHLRSDALQRCDDTGYCWGGTIQAYRALLSTGTGLVERGLFSSGNLIINTPTFIDMNGDGRTDIVWVQGGGIWFALGKGDGMFDAQYSGHPVSASLACSPIIDWDGDGRDDFLLPDFAAGHYKLYRSTGTTFDPPVAVTLPLPPSTSCQPKALDANGDGMSDFLTYDASALRIRTHSGVVSDFARRFVDGFGNAQEVSYRPITDGSIYTKLTGAATPAVRDYQGAKHVVDTATRNDGVGGTYTETWRYTGARLNVHGRGFLGFATTSVTDSRNGLTTTRTFHQDFPHIGTIQEERLKQGVTTLALSTLTVDSHAFGTGYSTHFLPYTKASVEEQREINGSLVRTIGTTNTVDIFGNITDSVVVTADSIGNEFRTETHRDYLNDTTNWCLGRMSFEAVTQKLPDGALQTRTKTATHDTAFCRIETLTDQPGPLRVFTEYDYDVWGNQSVITVTGAGMPSRQTIRNFAPEGVFPTETWNPKGQKTTQGWNYALGVETSRTDANGLTVTWLHDSFGRQTRETRPDGTRTTLTREYCSLGCGVSNGYHKVTATITNAGGASGGTSHKVFDTFDREVRSSRRLLAGAEAHGLTQYDTLGRVYRRSAPFFSGGGVYWSTFSYDVLNRLKLENHPLSESQPTGRLVQYGYNGLVTSVTDPRNGIVTTERNAIGQTVKVIDALNGATRYTYYPFGEIETVTDHLGNVKAMTYDVRGNKASMTDPDMSLWQYHHNALGELDTQTDPKNVTTTFLYDALGRMTHRYEPEHMTEWEYDTASGKGIGRLASVRMQSGPTLLYAEYYVYDGVGRPIEVATDINDGALHAIGMTYDDLGRIRTVDYPETIANVPRFSVRYDYDTSGVLSQAVNATNSAVVYWRAERINPWGAITSERLGNGLITTRDYDSARGHLKSVSTGGGLIQNLSYAWDASGNLERRTALRSLSEEEPRDMLAACNSLKCPALLSNHLNETFTYDALNRLAEVRLNGNVTLEVDYNAIGNITNKTGVGGYSYGAKPHAVMTAGINTFAYDASGNMTSRSGANVAWTSYNYPSAVAGPTGLDSFSYGPSRARYRHHASQIAAGLPLTSTETIYVGGLYEKVATTLLTDHRHYVMVAGRAVAQVTRTASADAVHYFHRDHQGSLDAITDDAGQVQARLSFDAYGQRRDPLTWSGAPTALDLAAIQAITSRGYTGHEMLDASGTIHMNGRVYDPALGRFLSADPTVPDPWSGQSHNRYSYVVNNPLTLVDPSGFDPEPEPGTVGTIPCCQEPDNFNYGGADRAVDYAGFNFFSGGVLEELSRQARKLLGHTMAKISARAYHRRPFSRQRVYPESEFTPAMLGTSGAPNIAIAYGNNPGSANGGAAAPNVDPAVAAGTVGAAGGLVEHGSAGLKVGFRMDGSAFSAGDGARVYGSNFHGNKVTEVFEIAKYGRTLGVAGAGAGVITEFQRYTAGDSSPSRAALNVLMIGIGLQPVGQPFAFGISAGWFAGDAWLADRSVVDQFAD
jgi:RHS repeat-associated protein